MPGWLQVPGANAMPIR